MIRTILLFFLLFFLSVCLFTGCSGVKEKIPENPLFTRLDAVETGIDFRNEVIDLENFNIFNYRNFYNGGGVALGDINNNGLIDIYFTSNQGSNRLYLNEGNFQFRDITESAGVSGSGAWTTGVTMVDINGNGLLDIYVLNSGIGPENTRRNELFINRGDLTFGEEAAAFNLDDPGHSVHASFFDFDGDGDLDLYLLNNSFRGTADQVRALQQTSREQVGDDGGDKFFRNDGGTFTDISEEAGIYRSDIGFGLGVSVGDLTGNHRPDIYVSNDFWERDYLYINRGDGTFSEELIDRTGIISLSSMGSDIADINNDGLLDIFITDMLPADHSRLKTMTVFEDYRSHDEEFYLDYFYQMLQNTLQINNGIGTFTETAFLSGVAATDWSWGALFFDFGNNGWKDLFVSNGIYRDITDLDFTEFISDRDNIVEIITERGSFEIIDFLDRIPSVETGNFAFVNNGDKTFSDQSFSLGFHEPAFSNGAAYADLNNNGALDLVVNNLNGEAFIYRNNASEFHETNYLKIRFEGEGLNRFGIGAHVKLYTGSQVQTAENITTRSFQSSVPPEVHFGLGNQTTADSLVVVWPDHKMQVLKNIDANRELVLIQEQADMLYTEPAESENNPIITDISDLVISGNTRHSENNFIDFDRQLLLPRKLSTEGPQVVVGDLNGTGREDFFVTGALNDPDKVFIQDEDGTFTSLLSPDFIGDVGYESTAAALLDINGNGHPDLMVGSGGNQFGSDSESLQIRVYINNGEGIFSRNRNLEPSVRVNTSRIAVHDFNGDAYPDVFIGGRVVSGEYGVNPKSYLLQNDGNGGWVDVTPDELMHLGMVTDAIWADYDDSGKKGLVVVGEWMPVTFFRNHNGSLEFDYSIKKSNGWWTSIDMADLKGDGKPEFIIGNWGLNSRFRASYEKPITMFVNVLKSDGTTGFVINTYPPGKDELYPFHTYRDLMTVYPELRNRVPDHHTFASMSFDEIFIEAQRRGAERKEIHTLHSSILVDNNGRYELQELPSEAQVSPVFAASAADFSGNGQNDILLLGNLYGLKPEVGRFDSNNGVILENLGNLEFSFIPYGKTQTWIDGEVRDVSFINTVNGRKMIVGRNNEELMFFRME